MNAAKKKENKKITPFKPKTDINALKSYYDRGKLEIKRSQCEFKSEKKFEEYKNWEPERARLRYEAGKKFAQDHYYGSLLKFSGVIDYGRVRVQTSCKDIIPDSVVNARLNFEKARKKLDINKVEMVERVLFDDMLFASNDNNEFKNYDRYKVEERQLADLCYELDKLVLHYWGYIKGVNKK